MIKHLWKLIWNKKKQNFLLMSEMLVSFVVLFAVFTLVVYYYQNYRKPLGFSYENVWVVSFTNSPKQTPADSMAQFHEILKQSMKSMPQVKAVSFTNSNVPFAMSTEMNDLTYGKVKTMGNFHHAEAEYAGVLGLSVLQGRWFTPADRAGKLKPVVISQTMKEKLFGNDHAVGAELTIGEGPEKVKVVGVVADSKEQGDYQAVEPAFYQLMDTAAHGWVNSMLVKVSPDADAAFEGKLYKLLANSFKDSNVEIDYLSKKRVSKNNITLVPMLILLVVAAFLIINVALGLFGVLWYNINKRKGEIGLRRAVGASAGAISRQLLGEALVLSTISLLVGCFFAIQFPLLHVFDLPASVYLAAMVLAIVFIYALVLLCAWYPGKQAADIYPAVALHED